MNCRTYPGADCDTVARGMAESQAVVPPSPNPGQSTLTQPAIDQYDAVSTFHNGDFCEARLQMLCSGCLELTTEKCR